MPEYIDRESALEAVEKSFIRYGDEEQPEEYDFAFQLINELPSAAVAPVKHGEWIPFLPEYGDMFKCSVCGIIIRLPVKIKQKPMPYRFCPNCGAKMEEE